VEKTNKKKRKKKIQWDFLVDPGIPEMAIKSE